MYCGVAYYPEHWPESRWAVDARMMQKAGVNAVRMGEFAWSVYELNEGKLDFSMMDRAIDLLGKHGIGTLMCTCSRTPPPWVYRKYPEIRNVEINDRPGHMGIRYRINLTSPKFIEISRRIDGAVIEHFAKRKEIIGWHIDNEIGAELGCHSELATKAFQEYLRAKYGSIDKLNEAWGANFWSFTFSCFEDVTAPGDNEREHPGWVLEWRRFWSHNSAEFAKWRYDLMKRFDPDKWVTTNFQHTVPNHTDPYELGKATDIYGTNFYPPGAREFALDYCRGQRGQLFMLELRSGPPVFQPHVPPGHIRLWAYASLAHGACGLFFYRWRTCQYGGEMYWHGVLPHSGNENRRYRELAVIGKEVAQIGEKIERTRPKAEAAIVMAYESRWALDFLRKMTPELRTDTDAYRFHTTLMNRNVPCDGFSPRDDLSGYRLIIAPRLYLVDDKIAKNLINFVEKGGILCLTPRSGSVDEYNKAFDVPSPGPLREIAGVEADDYGTLKQPLKLKALSGPAVTEATLWQDELVVKTAKVLATYEDGLFKDAPAVTINKYGKGKVIYTGTVLQGQSLQALVDYLCELAGVKPIMKTPGAVRAYQRVGKDIRLLFLVNFGDKEETVAVDGAWKDAFTGEAVASAAIKGGDVKVLEQSISGC